MMRNVQHKCMYIHTTFIFHVCVNMLKAPSISVLINSNSMKKAAVVLGIREDNVITVKCNKS